VFIIFPIIIYGLALRWINRESFKNVSQSSAKWFYKLTAYIGIPIHEFCHFIMAFLFGTTIMEIVWYDPNWTDEDEDSIGHVSYAANPDSLLHHIGHFFIGIAPMIGGCVIIYFLMRFILPNTYNSLCYLELKNFNGIQILTDFFNCINNNIMLIFSNSDGIIRTLIFFIFAFSICIYMDVSLEDIKIAKKGLVMVEIFLFILSIFLFIYKYTIFIDFIFVIASVLYFLLTLGIIFSLISFLISFVVRLL